MALTTGSADVSGLLPDQIGALVVQPVLAGSVAAQASTVVNISSHDYRVPVVTADPSAAWVAEGASITASDATFAELTCTPSKVAGLSIISRELAEDSSPSAQQAIGDGLARDLARKIDAAFFGNTTTNGPKGLGSLTTSVATYANGGMADLDWAADALSASESKGGNLSAFLMNPADALAIAKLKTLTTGSNEPLVGGTRNVLGVPIIVSSAATSGTIYGVDSRFVQFVVRDNTRLEVDKSAYFASDQVGIKATMRVGFVFTSPLALVKVTAAAA